MSAGESGRLEQKKTRVDEAREIDILDLQRKGVFQKKRRYDLEIIVVAGRRNPFPPKKTSTMLSNTSAPWNNQYFETWPPRKLCKTIVP